MGKMCPLVQQWHKRLWVEPIFWLDIRPFLQGENDIWQLELWAHTKSCGWETHGATAIVWLNGCDVQLICFLSICVYFCGLLQLSVSIQVFSCFPSLLAFPFLTWVLWKKEYQWDSSPAILYRYINKKTLRFPIPSWSWRKTDIYSMPSKS